jgi:hypothetical protein
MSRAQYALSSSEHPARKSACSALSRFARASSRVGRLRRFCGTSIVVGVNAIAVVVSVVVAGCIVVGFSSRLLCCRYNRHKQLTYKTTLSLLSTQFISVILISMGTDKPLLNFVIAPELLKRVDDFRFKNRFATRAAAIKWLLDWALDQKPAVPKAE